MQAYHHPLITVARYGTRHYVSLGLNEEEVAEKRSRGLKKVADEKKKSRMTKKEVADEKRSRG